MVSVPNTHVHTQKRDARKCLEVMDMLISLTVVMVPPEYAYVQTQIGYIKNMQAFLYITEFKMYKKEFKKYEDNYLDHLQVSS